MRPLLLSAVAGLILAASDCAAAEGAARPADAAAANVEIVEMHGHKAFICAAPVPAKGKPWLWYAPLGAGAVLLNPRSFYVDGLMRAGIGIVGVDLGEVRGAPGSTAEFTEFYDELVQRGWSAQPILLGQSRGGLMLLGWAMRHPAKVRAFVGIFPVCNLATWGMRAKGATLMDY